MKYDYYDEHIIKNTLGRYDITPLFSDQKVFSNLIKDLSTPFANKKIDKIVGLDALGFVIGGAIASSLKIGFVPVRKEGKLPSPKESLIQAKVKDYSNKEVVFEMNKNSIKKGEKIAIVDDWIETGAQIKAAIELIEKQGGIVECISVLFAEKNKKTIDLFNNYSLNAIKIVED